jgi:hypothetical protein
MNEDPLTMIELMNDALRLKHPHIVVLLALYALGTRYHSMERNPMYEKDFAGSLDALGKFTPTQLIVTATEGLLGVVAQHQIDRDGFIAMPLDKPPAELMDMIFGKPETEA